MPSDRTVAVNTSLIADGSRNYFPDRIPRRVDFTIDETDPQDQYARMYADDVVSIPSTT